MDTGPNTALRLAHHILFHWNRLGIAATARCRLANAAADAIFGVERIEAKVLIPGRGKPVTGGVVLLDGARIAYAGPATDAPSSPDATVHRADAVLPGMWDCHGHFLGARSFDLNRIALESSALRGARCARDLRAAIDAGITSVREVGGLGIELTKAVTEGVLVGPAVYPAGALLSTTGGHGDLHGLPCASGGVMSEVDHPMHQQFTVSELRAIVEVAGMADRVVAAHCHGKPGIMAAVEAGARTIEHGTYLDEEACDAMREGGVILVPTCTIVDEALTSDTLPPYARDKLIAIKDRHATAVAMAYERGVTIAMGTDIALSGDHLPAHWGGNGRELALLVEAGLNPLEATEAATATALLTLGPQAPRSGQLATGTT